jgi:hypothetical protein
MLPPLLLLGPVPLETDDGDKEAESAPARFVVGFGGVASSGMAAAPVCGLVCA